MSFLKKIFGGGSGGGDEAHSGEPVDYNGFTIRAAPYKADGGYQCSGVITREIGGETKEHTFIRADRCQSLDEAMAISLRKAQQIVDQQGDRIFD